jgi:hypothetical protein
LPLQTWFPTSAGLTPVAGRKRPQLQLRYSHPRRAHARRSCECAFLHRKNRFFADKRSHCNKSGGRKPPVGNKTPLQIATAYLRRYAPAAAVVAAAWPGVANRNRFSATTCVRATRSGWRKPAVVSRNALAAATSQLSRRGEWSAVCTRTPLQLRYRPRRADAGRWTKASAIAIALLTPTAGSRPPLLVVGSVYPEQRSILPAQRSYHTPTAG